MKKKTKKKTMKKMNTMTETQQKAFDEVVRIYGKMSAGNRTQLPGGQTIDANINNTTMRVPYGLMLDGLMLEMRVPYGLMLDMNHALLLLEDELKK